MGITAVLLCYATKSCRATTSFSAADETPFSSLLRTTSISSTFDREIHCPGSYLAKDAFDLTTPDTEHNNQELSLSPERYVSSPFLETSSFFASPRTIDAAAQHPKAQTSNDHINKTIPKITKTGTTIVGVAIDGICVLAADTRATAGSLVADARAEKLHILNAKTVAAGAGTSADLQHITRECAAVAALQSRWNQVGNGFDDCDKDDSTTSHASVLDLVYWLRKRLYERNGSCQANLIVGGIHHNGKAQLRAVHPHGSVDVVSFTALGSGGMAAMSVLEQGYPALATAADPRQAAQDLCIQAIRAGIENDLGSGSHVDICVVDASSGCVMTRGVYPEEGLPPMKQLRDEYGDTGGVNGFGNVPFVLQSPRVVRPSDIEVQKDKLNRWSSLLLINDGD